MSSAVLNKTSNVSFADIAHQTITFDRNDSCDQMILELLDTPWVQRLRSISQTGNTKLVYMFAEHSRFGHCLGVAYLVKLLMKNLENQHHELIEPYRKAVAAAALLHDLGHVAPGSHLGERVWSVEGKASHELISEKIIRNDPLISQILESYESGLVDKVCEILSEGDKVPPWTVSVISGGGWNADRGNWAIVDSAMCCVSYGRYNVLALIDAFRLSEKQSLVIGENRSDALTHFFVARDSMYRQVYQHRVLQAADALSCNIVARCRELLAEDPGALQTLNIFADQTMKRVLSTSDYSLELSLEDIFQMDEHWWNYHLNQWMRADDPILKDLSGRLRERKLFKTVRVEDSSDPIIERAKSVAIELGFDPKYYLTVIEEMDKHRGKEEESPKILMENGSIVPATETEPLIAHIMSRPASPRTWLAVPHEVKERLGRIR